MLLVCALVRLCSSSVFTPVAVREFRSGFLDYDPVMPVGAMFGTADDMPFFLHAYRNIFERLAVVEQNFNGLTTGHFIQKKPGLHKIGGTRNAAQIQMETHKGRLIKDSLNFRFRLLHSTHGQTSIGSACKREKFLILNYRFKELVDTCLHHFFAAYRLVSLVFKEMTLKQR